ncbi:ISL3 family transposase [Gemmatimonadota bacterium]
MRDIDLFQQALGLTPPWRVKECKFDPDGKRLDLYLDFPRGGTFECPECGQSDCKAYDTQEKTWRHLNFFEHQTYLHARLPRVQCPVCGIKTVTVPWARSGSGFTLLFEAFVMALVKEMPVKAAARQVGEQDTRIWRILNHYVEQARDQADFSGVTHVGIDETSSRKRHNYISVFVDLAESRVLYATEGRSATAVAGFKQDLIQHGGSSDRIEDFCLDMWPAYIKGIREHFPKSQMTFDKFHIQKMLNGAVDEVRRKEQKDNPDLKHTRYLWLTNPEKLRADERALLQTLTPRNRHLKTSRAYAIKQAFQEFWELPEELAEPFLKKWYFWATHSRLPAMIDVARTIKNHWDGVLRWFKSRINNGVLEGINSLIQAAKARARGYRTTRNLITIVYLIMGKLRFALPT